MQESVIHWNCNGLVHHYSEFKLLLHEKDPICVCLQETHLRPEQPYSLRNYNIIRKDVDTGERAHFGVAIVIKDYVQFQKLDINTGLQMVAIKILTPINITVCSIYLHHGEVHIDDLRNVIRQLPRPFIIAGDFNAHNPIWGSVKLDPRGRMMGNLLDSVELILLNDGSVTHIPARSETFSNIDLAIASSSIGGSLKWMVMDDAYNSDHYPCEIKLDIMRSNKQSSKYWIMSRANWRKFNQMVTSSVITHSDNINVETLTNMIQQAAIASIPLGGGNSGQKRLPWWNNEIAKSIKIKKRTLNIYKKNPTIENMISYKRARAISRRLMLESRRKSWKDYISTITSDSLMTEVWNKVRSINGKRSYRQITHLRSSDDNILTDPVEIANAMVHHFAHISSTTNYSAEFISIKMERETPLNFITETDLPYNAPIQLFELEDALKKAKKSAPGPDMINYEMIDHLPDRLKRTLLKIYNKLWQVGEYPQEWKLATIVPILKEGKDPLDLMSYRPISLTCCLGKLMERIISSRLSWWLEKHNLLAPYQMGFRKHRSTIDQITYVEDYIQNSFKDRQHAVMVFFDIEKAYDTAWRYNILQQLYSWGIRGNLPIFISSFLSDRMLQVRIEHNISDSLVLENGVPQGSTLSCLCLQ